MLQDEATRKKQAGVGEVAEVSPRAGAERADGGGVLSGARVVRAALFRLEETVARGGWRPRGGSHAPRGVCGSASGSGRVGAGGRYAGAERGLMVCDDDGTLNTLDDTDARLIFVERGIV